KEVALSSFKGRIVILQWINPECPVCQRVSTDGIVAKMLEAAKAAKDDVVHLPISSSSGAKSADIAKYLADHKVEAKGLMDGDGKVGHSYGAKTTPHMFVIDDKGVLRYAGAIDDDPDGKKGEKAVNYVVAAVKAIAEGKKVSPETTKSYGCSIKYAK
ncbi:MAG TPA: redoxin family protein, partial [Planctomycetota bacterium]|nr:redoxin family protein [Planctomycetota bacterium]